MRTLILFILMNLPVTLRAQCAKYDNAMRKGEEYLYLKEPDFDKALIEFQTAQIAARECRLPGDKSEHARQKLEAVFAGLKSRRDEAVEAKQRAEKAQVKIGTLLRSAREAQFKAEAAKDTADYLRLQTLKQKEQADAFGRQAQKEKNLNVSLNLALQSTLTEDSLMKIERAMSAYRLNTTDNEGTWMPEITRALLGSIPSNAVRPLLKLNAGIIDLFKIGGDLYLVTDSGELHKFENGTSRKLWSDPGLYYINNSWKYDSTSAQLSLTSKNNRIFLLEISPGAVKLLGASQNTKTDKVWLASNEYLLYPDGVFQVTGDSIQQRFHFTTAQMPSAFAISPGREIVALGTAGGWLTVRDNSAMPKLDGQFQLEHTRINDIVFDQRGEFIATAGNDGRIRLNKVEFIGERAPIELNIGSWVNAIYFLEARELLIGAKDGSLYVLNFDQDMLAAQCRNILNKTRGNIKYKR